jgi:hypothetical protein
VVNQFKGSVSGAANVETGEAVTKALLTSRVYNGNSIDNPCPRCTDLGGAQRPGPLNNRTALEPAQKRPIALRLSTEGITGVDWRGSTCSGR